VWARQVSIPLTTSVPPFCVRECSDRLLKHNLDLYGMSPMQYLSLGAPPGEGWNGDDCFSKNYFISITHDEDLMLFGNPNVNAHITMGELALLNLVSRLTKEEEQREAYWLKKSILHYEQCIADREIRGLDIQYFLESLHVDLLRLIRLTKDSSWIVHFRET
jgi:hypothetical protein